MPRKQTITRLALARRLQAVALALAADKPIRVGRTLVRVPERVKFEQEVEKENGEMELELEITWPDGSEQKKSAAKKTRARSKSRKR